ncbi:NAD(P)-dependent oxidoreductase [Nocardia rhizosphaerae]|uniref:NAD(P)-dependent oxidoreductase n=1 Tax=Nocardia rhizosphaerae TaxID=1691571 RepID=A0ABV8LBZ2_9NOCA
MTGRLPRVAVVGLGAMGSRLAHNLCARGYSVRVANRSPEPVQRLVAAGATAAGSPAEAAAKADVVLVAVRDDAASEQVWLDPATGIAAAAAPGTTAVELSTLSPGWIRRLAAAADAAGLRFLEAPMIGSRPQAEAGALVHLAGGPADVLTDVRAVLEVSASRIHHVGAYGAAATLKLIVNASLATQVATAAELLRVLRSTDLDHGESLRILTELPVTSPALARAIGVMSTGDFSPNFPVHLVAKDLDYLAALAEDVGVQTPMARTALDGYRRAESNGLGAADLTAIAAGFDPPEALGR